MSIIHSFILGFPTQQLPDFFEKVVIQYMISHFGIDKTTKNSLSHSLQSVTILSSTFLFLAHPEPCLLHCDHFIYVNNFLSSSARDCWRSKLALINSLTL